MPAMNTDNAKALLNDLLRAFPDETVRTGQRIRHAQAAALNTAIIRAKDILAGVNQVTSIPMRNMRD